MVVGDGRHDSANLRHEAHVRHLIGLIETHNADVVETCLPPLYEVDETAGGCNEQLDTGVQGVDLVLHGGAAVHGDQTEPTGCDKGLKIAGHLHGEFSCWDKHQRPWTERLGPLEAFDDREPERKGLPRTGLCLSEYVDAGKPVRNRRRLDGEGGFESCFGQYRDELGGYAEVGEGRVCGEFVGHDRRLAEAGHSQR